MNDMAHGLLSPGPEALAALKAQPGAKILRLIEQLNTMEPGTKATVVNLTLTPTRTLNQPQPTDCHRPKAIVFTQFAGMLTKLAHHLPEASTRPQETGPKSRPRGEQKGAKKVTAFSGGLWEASGRNLGVIVDLPGGMLKQLLDDVCSNFGRVLAASLFSIFAAVAPFGFIRCF